MGLVRDAISPLLGQAPDPKLVQAIRDSIMSYPQVLGTHDLMVHDYGPGRQFASAHVEMPGEGDAFEHHEILDTIEHDIKHQMGIGITLHCDPIATTGDDLRGWVKRGIMQIDILRSPSTTCTSTMALCHLTLCVPTALTYPTRSCWGSSRASCTSADPMPHVVTFDSGFSSPDRPAEQL